MNSSAGTNESSGSEFFETTSGIHFGPHPFDKSKSFMNFLIKVEVRETFCSLKLVVKWKTGKEIPESLRLNFLKKFLVNKTAL